MAHDIPGGVIAVVDDDHRILESLQILLESDDHTVRLFASGSALLESARLSEIDCLISDVAMPDMDGFELVRRVHAAHPALPIILISGQHDVVNGFVQIGAGRYRLLKKPFDGSALLRAVTDALRAA